MTCPNYVSNFMLLSLKVQLFYLSAVLGTAKESTSEPTEITFSLIAVQVVGLFLWSGRLAGWQKKISFMKNFKIL